MGVQGESEAVTHGMTGGHRWDEGESERLRRTHGLNEETAWCQRRGEKRSPTHGGENVLVLQKEMFSPYV